MRYIDASQLENKLIEHKKDEHSNLNKCGYDTWRNAFKIALRELHNTPTADVKPVVRGKWLLSPRFPYSVKCSICGRLEGLPISRNTKEYAIENYPFCHCGADMRGDSNENNT